MRKKTQTLDENYNKKIGYLKRALYVFQKKSSPLTTFPASKPEKVDSNSILRLRIEISIIKSLVAKIFNPENVKTNIKRESSDSTTKRQKKHKDGHSVKQKLTREKKDPPTLSFEPVQIRKLFYKI